MYADKAYYSTEQLHWLEVDRGIRSWIPIPDKSSQVKDREAGISFVYQAQTDTYRCSEGKSLPRKQINRPKQFVTYQGKECGDCNIKEKCTTADNRTIQIPFLQPWIDQYRERMRSHQGKQAIRKRSAWVEHPFGTLKSWMGQIPLNLRGKRKVQTEIDLYTTAYNFKRLIGIQSPQQIENQIKAYNWIAP